jgi:hypothetical protein
MPQISLLRTILFAVVAATTAIGIAFAATPTAPATTAPDTLPAFLRNNPMTISMSSFADSPLGKPWTLSVNSAGQAELTISGGKRKQFTVPPENLMALRAALAKERFFDLQNQYGEIVPDGGWDTIAITVGDQTKSVRLDFLGNWIKSDPAKLREPARALRITTLIRGWFDDPEAFDTRPYDKLAIDAAK